MSVTGVTLDVDGAAAPPRSNGELVFDEPWQSRAFGMAVTLADAGAFGWDAFRERLIARIGEWEGTTFRYYDHWLAALEDVLVDAGDLGTGDVETRSTVLAARPAGHDHRHDGHGHGHDGPGHGHGHGTGEEPAGL